MMFSSKEELMRIKSVRYDCLLVHVVPKQDIIMMTSKLPRQPQSMHVPILRQNLNLSSVKMNTII